ncbi:hypothetical protein BSKO_00326 [Bryopsis sp. KO-2023]|nr:hypothetical protein BSKO_00326 [Bryopsis sp. KO-2023]
MARRLACEFLLAALAVSIHCSSAYYVPGTYPQKFEYNFDIQAQVNSLTSYETELPYEYYTLPFCKPAEGVKKIKGDANPGTILLGLRIESSPYDFKVMVEEHAKSACSDGKAPALTKRQTKNLRERIKEDYRVNMVLDNLPVTEFDLTYEDLTFVRPGFPLGIHKDDKFFINNHLHFRILVHPTTADFTAKGKQDTATIMDTMGGKKKRKLLESTRAGDIISGSDLAALVDGSEKNSRSLLQEPEIKMSEEEIKVSWYMVVGFEVMPCSVKHKPNAQFDVKGDCQTQEMQEVVEGAEIPYTYDVTWGLSNVEWASRWDTYLRMPGGKVHWFSILNSMLVVVVMAIVCAMILIRTVRRDLAHYEELIMDGGATAADLKEEAGWKLVSGDVFRAPSNATGLAVRVGSGVQIIATATVTLFFSVIGFLSPASRGSLLTALLVLYLLLAVFAGFASVWLWGIVTRSYESWRGMCWRVSLYFPGITMLVFTIVNMFIHHTGSTGAIPVSTYFSIVTLWFIVSIPLTFLGGYFGTRLPILEYPTRTNQIPRHIPSPPLATHPWLLFFISGLLPFGTLFIELYFVMSSIWMGYYYYLFGYLALIGILTFLITTEVSILCSYVQLCAEDYLWWWQSFYRGGSIALYLMIYSFGFLFTTLHNLSGFLSVMLYVCYTGIFVWGIYLAMGTVGFLSSLAFTYGIFRSVKLD